MAIPPVQMARGMTVANSICTILAAKSEIWGCSTQFGKSHGYPGSPGASLRSRKSTTMRSLWVTAAEKARLRARQRVADGFTPDNAGLSPFMQRLARAHANCVEGLPIFGGLLAIAIMTSRTAITDPLAFWFLARGSCSQLSISFRPLRQP